MADTQASKLLDGVVEKNSSYSADTRSAEEIITELQQNNSNYDFSKAETDDEIINTAQEYANISDEENYESVYEALDYVDSNFFQGDIEKYMNVVKNGVESYGDELVNSTANLNYINEYVSSASQNFLTKAEQQLGIDKIQSSIAGITQDYNTLKNSLDFSNVVSSSKAYYGASALETASNALNKTEDILKGAESLYKHSEELIGNLKNSYDTVKAGAQRVMDDLKNTDWSTYLSNKLSELPGFLWDQIKNLSVVKDAMVLINSTISLCKEVPLVISSLKCEFSFSVMLANVSLLKSLLNKVKQLAQKITQYAKALQNYAEMIKNGQYLQAMLALTQTCPIVQRLMNYDTIYPFGKNYRTKNGTTFINDDTDGKVVYGTVHPTGSQSFTNADGDWASQAAGNCQLTAKKNVEVHSSADTKIISDKTCDIRGNEVGMQASEGIIMDSAGHVKISASGVMGSPVGGSVFINSQNATSITSGKSVVVSGAVSSEISSKKETAVTSNLLVKMHSDGAVSITAGSNMSLVCSGLLSLAANKINIACSTIVNIASSNISMAAGLTDIKSQVAII